MNKSNDDKDKTTKDVVELKVLRDLDNDGRRQLQDRNGLIVSISEGLIVANGLVIEEEILAVSGDLYWAWFSQGIKEERQKLDNLLRMNFGLVVKNRHAILRKPAYLAITSKLLSSGGAYIGEVSYSLGALLETWENSNRLDAAEEIKMIRISGSPLSGNNKYLAWDMRKGEFVEGRANGFMRYFAVFGEMAGKHPKYQDSVLRPMASLLQSLGIDVQ